MADTPAERQRRSRAHRRGNHLFCRPDRCPAAAAAAGQPVATQVTAEVGGVTAVTVTAEPEVVTPDDAGVELGPRGRRLWQGLVEAMPAMTPGQRVLAEEACRMADRLDHLAKLLGGDEPTWLRLHVPPGDGDVRVVVDAVLSEARQHAGALRQVLAELRGPTARTGMVTGRPTGKGGGIADLTARIARRSAQTAG